ncbi:hypothetical protein [Staphylococcus haemolyticus]|uniref:hypothetical protein n=1 Tax=Staphylococcus haemolyticus TaxID=1283 RepID=UPI00069D40D5|nr:hypothetical protein [Staphylococcus haemolyticus]
MKKVLGIALAAGLLLTACGSNGSPAAKEENVKFGEIMNKGKQVTYAIGTNKAETNAPNKFNPIYCYIFSDNGKITVYHSKKDVKLKDMKDKSYDDILKEAKKENKEHFEESKKDKINDLEAEDADEKALNEVKNLKYKEPKERDLKIDAFEDGTGNHTRKEKFYVTSDGFDGTEYINDTKALNNYYYYIMRSSADTINIYDKNYAYLDNGEYGRDRMYLITEVGKNTKSSELDEPDSKYVKTYE